MSKLIQDIELSNEEKAELSSKIAAANKVLVEKCLLWDLPNPRAMRQEYLSHKRHVRGGFLKFDQESRKALETNISLENTVLAGYIRGAYQLANSFYLTSRADKPFLDEDDFVQEAAWAILDAIYCYDGSTELITYLYCSVKKRLINFIRSSETHAGIGRKTKKLRRRIREIMNGRGCTFDEAIVVLRKTEAISVDVEDMLRHACYRVSYIAEDHVVSTEPEENISDEVQLLLKAVARADLTPIQRQLIEGFLRTGERIDMRLVNECTNPNTGNPYTRSGLSQQWIRACDKVKMAMLPDQVAA